MNVVGIGTDIIECERIAQMIAKHDEIFIDRVFTPLEVEYCGKRRSSVQHYAGRWAAKEAILKAMGTGWAKGIKWRDLEIQTLPGGQPVVQLGGVAKEICDSKGISKMLISISHTQGYATAFATAIGQPTPSQESDQG